MSAIVLVKCSNCFKRYPINPKKHKDREIKYCPFCKTPHKVKGRFGKFLPNPQWPKEKLHREAEKQYMKEMRTPRQKEKTPLTSIPENILALTLAILQREKEIEEEQRRKGAKPNP
jgi:Zn-finger nucleic acid-binding protein